MLNDNEYNSYIYLEENVLSEKICNSIIKRFENDPEKDFTSNDVHKFVVGTDISKTLGIIIDQYNDDWLDIFDILNQSVNTHIKKYFKKTNFKSGLYKNIYFPYCNIQKILKGGFYKPHVDVDTYIKRNKTNTKRIVTCIWYLNDVNDGGETHFLQTGLKVKPKTGRIVFFPSRPPFVHEGLPPVSNTKYIISCWLEVEEKYSSYSYI